MARIFILLVLTGLPLVAFTQATEIFAIQIGTYKHFAEDAKESVRKFGEVHVLTYENLSRVTVGEFTSKQEAMTVLHQLREAGFKDAFIRQIGYVDLTKVQSDIEKFNLLVAEMDAQVFYIDEYKYIFEGSGYIQLPKDFEIKLHKK